MAYIPRSISPVLTGVTKISVHEHAQLRAAGAVDSNYWNVQPDADKEIFRKFKAEVKEHYFFGQTRRCCYCSFELRNDHASFDAEHILDKSTHGDFMFSLDNLAVSCKPCNRGKSVKSPLVKPQPLAAVPTQSSDYRIVHPHLDHWDAHLEFDELDRIKSRAGSAKGSNTIEMCNITSLNAARLSDHFIGNRSSAERLLRKFFDYKSLRKKAQALSLLRALTQGYGLVKASSIVDRLEQEI
jgi:hypothetical protein